MSSNTPIVEIKKIEGTVIFSTVEALNKFARELVKKGYTVVSPSTPSVYITVVHPSNKYVGIEQNRWHNLGAKFGFNRQYIPSKENGSALQIMGDAELTIENLQHAFSMPISDKIRTYSSLDMFLKEHTWQGLNVSGPAGKFHYPKNSYGTIS